jgi:hypothetical protein
MNPDDLPFPASLCHRCAFVRYNGNKRGSIFVQCTAPGLDKYYPQPVGRCQAMQAAPAPNDPKLPS